MWPFRKKEKQRPARSDPVISNRKPLLPRHSKNGQLMERNFNASLGDRLNSSWTSVSQTPDNLIFHNLKILRARSREQRYNNDYARKFIGMVKTNVVGAEGVVLQSKVMDYSNNPDSVVRTAIENTWRDWHQVCDFKGRLHWIDFQNVLMAAVAGDGEILIRKHGGSQYGYTLELIDPELLDVTYIGEHGNNRIVHGIELDNTGRPVAYHLSQPEANQQTYLNYYNNKHYLRVPASEIIHAYLCEFVDQKRGIPWIATGLQRLKMLGAYEDASLVAARIGASQMGFFKSSSNDQFEGDEENDDGFEMEAEPGMFRNIGNLDFQSFNPDYPKGEFSDFMKQCLRGISSGLGVDYNTFANDMSDVNYSSARVGMLETREVWIGLQGWLIRNVIRPIFDEWLERQHDLGTINIPRKNKPPAPLNRELAYYKPAVFQGRRWKWVDPAKEMTAHEKGIGLKITTRSQIIREQGGDPDQVFNEIAEEERRLKELGIFNAMTTEQETEPKSQENNDDANNPQDESGAA
ncbi:phage portal protein [Endozoicomonas sp. Mp262]|uniref:phage portal protein n=1 Tax=Endozoicomonas sp. Mp262 TaxID=2919499 RepID=UPI0021DABA06